MYNRLEEFPSDIFSITASWSYRVLGRRWHIPREEEEEEDKEDEEEEEKEEKEEEEEKEGNRKRRRAGKKKKSNNPTMQGRTQTKLYIYN